MARGLLAGVWRLARAVRCADEGAGGGEAREGADHGLGAGYVWARSLESGLQLARAHRRPLMLIVHKSWCKACLRLKPKFSQCAEIQELSKQFVLVNVVDEDEPKDPKYAPDGTYIPRILFLTPQGEVYPGVFNEAGSAEHKHFYSRTEDIVASMRRVLAEEP